MTDQIVRLATERRGESLVFALGLAHFTTDSQVHDHPTTSTPKTRPMPHELLGVVVYAHTIPAVAVPRCQRALRVI